MPSVSRKAQCGGGWEMIISANVKKTPVNHLDFFSLLASTSTKPPADCLITNQAQAGPKNYGQADLMNGWSLADSQRHCPWLCWIATAGHGVLAFPVALVPSQWMYAGWRLKMPPQIRRQTTMRHQERNVPARGETWTVWSLPNTRPWNLSYSNSCSSMMHRRFRPAVPSTDLHFFALRHGSCNIICRDTHCLIV